MPKSDDALVASRVSFFAIGELLNACWRERVGELPSMGWRPACEHGYYRLLPQLTILHEQPRSHAPMASPLAKVLQLGLAAFLLCACAIAPEQHEVVVSADKLSELLARRISVDTKLLDVFHVRTGKPI